MVTDGPFAGDSGPVHYVDHERSRVRLLLLIFGSPTTVDLPLSSVEQLD